MRVPADEGREIFAFAARPKQPPAGDLPVLLVLHEFFNVLVRVAFWRLNPEHGSMLKEHPEFEELTPVPLALEKLFKDNLLPLAMRDDNAGFREKVMPTVSAVLTEHRGRLKAWWEKLPFDPTVASDKLGLEQWVSILKQVRLLP